MGRLTHDPELRQSQNGVMSCRFSVAIDRPQSAQAAQNGQERVTDFINCVAFNKTAEFVSRYFNKGKMILVEGSLRTGSYNDKNHPEVKHYTTDVWVDNVSFGETKSASSGASAGGYGGGYTAPQNNYSAPASQAAPQQAAPSVSVGSIDDFEEIINDSDLPF